MSSLEWLPSAQRLPAPPGVDGGAQDPRYPRRLVLHTTEGAGTVEDLARYYQQSTFWPNLTADVSGRVLAQHIPFSRAGRALTNAAGGEETNRAGAVQVEIIGWSADAPRRPASMVMPLLSDAQVDWLGGQLAPLFDMLPIARRALSFAPYPASYGLHNGVRMSGQQWREFSGVCGHQHVPENDHGDPGAFDVARFLEATKTSGHAPPSSGGPMDWHAPITKPVADADRDDPHAQGYWCVNTKGEVFAFGAAQYHGGHGSWMKNGKPIPKQEPGAKQVILNGPCAGLAPTPSGEGYWLLTEKGSIYTFGDAAYLEAPADRNT